MKQKQILILSTDSDGSTTKVIRWIHYLAPTIQVVRLHPEDVVNGMCFHNLSEKNISIRLKSTILNSNNIGVVWTRKWHSDVVNISTDDKKLQPVIGELEKNMQQEFCAVYDYFIYLLESNKKIQWLNRPKLGTPNKLQQLSIAKASGLAIPSSYVVSDFLNSFSHKRFVTKPITNCCNIEYNGKTYNNYTSIIDNNESPKLFLTYIQEEISKLLELRVFYLDGRCYTLSIHSQSNDKTKVDYRQYDYSYQNRLEYYNIPNTLVKKITIFMQKMNLQTGSLDFIYTPDEKFIFLEVNPCGQYDIFNSCNVNPDKLIAENLINKYYEYKR